MLRDKNTLTFMMIDLDFFKNYNDHYGHQAGDDCLIKVSSAIEGELFRPADVVARYGGEEFAVLLPGTETVGAMQVAERFVETVSALKIPHADSAVSDYVTVSVGVATSNDESHNSTEKLIKSADAALYDAKTSGRNRCKSADS
jgi:diguanylate cyclase (GGDEF)-like protein